MKTLLFLFAILLWSSVGSLCFAQSKGGHWQFENNGDDTAAWDNIANPGLLQGAASYSAIPPLLEGDYFLYLDPADAHEFFLVDDSDDLDFDDENIAISAWIYPLQIDEVQYLVNKGVQNTNPKTTNYSLRISNDKTLEFLIRDENDQAQSVSSSFTIAESTWTFIAAYYDFGLATVYLWNDASAPAVDTLAFDQPYFSNDDPLAIGSWYRDIPGDPSIRDFEGRMDDVRISGRLEDVLPGETGINPGPEQIPRSAELAQNYPNPFNPSTVIRYSLFVNSSVRLDIYNISGERIRQLVGRSGVPTAIQSAGLQSVVWDGTNEAGQPVAGGVYLYRLTAANTTLAKKMILLR